jgi:hypothetical protein
VAVRLPTSVRKVAGSNRRAVSVRSEKFSVVAFSFCVALPD